jgi:hypothetical protein
MRATYWVGIAFHINTSVCGSENFRDTAAYAGKLDVARSIPEVWLANKGFTVGPTARAGASPHFFLSTLHLTYFYFVNFMQDERIAVVHTHKPAPTQLRVIDESPTPNTTLPDCRPNIWCLLQKE